MTIKGGGGPTLIVSLTIRYPFFFYASHYTTWIFILDSALLI